jgi:hypothetical protein
MTNQSCATIKLKLILNVSYNKFTRLSSSSQHYDPHIFHRLLLVLLITVNQARSQTFLLLGGGGTSRLREALHFHPPHRVGPVLFLFPASPTGRG